MVIALDRSPSVGGEYVVPDYGAEPLGWAGRAERIGRRHIVLARAGDGRRFHFFGPLRVLVIRDMSQSEAMTVALWQRWGKPGVDLSGGGRVRIGDPTEGGAGHGSNGYVPGQSRKKGGVA